MNKASARVAARSRILDELSADPDWLEKLTARIQQDGPLPTRTPQSDSKVYFIRSGEDGPIKIGVSTDPARRLRALQTSHPGQLTLLGMVCGTFDVERGLHTRFAASRIRGELFAPTEELLAYIAAHASVIPGVVDASPAHDAGHTH